MILCSAWYITKPPPAFPAGLHNPSVYTWISCLEGIRFVDVGWYLSSIVTCSASSDIGIRRAVWVRRVRKFPHAFFLSGWSASSVWIRSACLRRASRSRMFIEGMPDFRWRTGKGVVLKIGRAALIPEIMAFDNCFRCNPLLFLRNLCFPLFHVKMLSPGHQASTPYKTVGRTQVLIACWTKRGGKPLWVLLSRRKWAATAKTFVVQFFVRVKKDSFLFSLIPSHRVTWFASITVSPTVKFGYSFGLWCYCKVLQLAFFMLKRHCIFCSPF